MSPLANPRVHDYEPTDDCSNWTGNVTPRSGDEQCMHGQYRTPHCSWCGSVSDAPWHTEMSR